MYQPTEFLRAASKTPPEDIVQGQPLCPSALKPGKRHGGFTTKVKRQVLGESHCGGYTTNRLAKYLQIMSCKQLEINLAKGDKTWQSVQDHDLDNPVHMDTQASFLEVRLAWALDVP